MKVVTLSNEKGGVGKTTMALHISMGLAKRGYRVLAIDGDPQRHLTLRMGFPEQPSIYDLLVRDANWNTKDLVKVVPPEKYGIPGETVPRAGGLLLLPGNKETRNIASLIADSAQLAMRLEELEGKVDVVVIDTPPTPSLLHGVFYTATHHILYPTELAYCSFDGLVESLKARAKSSKMRQEKWGLPSIEVSGIIPLKFRKRVSEDETSLKKLHEQFGNKVWPAIRLRTIWKEAEAKAVPVWAISRTCQAADDAWEVIDRVEESIKERKRVA